MSTDLIPFNYGDRRIRTVLVDDVPMVHHGDVCTVLEHTNPSMAIRLVEDGDRQKLDMRTVSAGGTALNAPATGNAEAWFITEAGFYDLVLASKAPGAKAFRRWITHDVIPAIRKSGAYRGAVVPQIPDMNTPEGQLQVAELLAAGARKQIEQAAEIKQLKPKADYVDAYVDGAGDATILRIVAKQLQVGEKWLRTLLVDKKIVARRIVGTRWSNSKQRNETQYEWYARRGFETWFVQRDQPEAPRLHNGQMQTTLYVTPVGKAHIAALVTREGEAS